MLSLVRVCLCGKSFKVKRPSIKQKFCSRSCGIRYSVVPVKIQVCIRCNNSFEFKGRTNCLYCKDCHTLQKREQSARSHVKHGRTICPGVGRGGNQVNKNNFALIYNKPQRTTYRKTCFKHWNKCCVICGSVKRIEVHHVDSDPLNFNPSNLVPLCRNCHNGLHATSKRSKLFEEELLFVLWKDGRNKIAEKNWNPETGIRGEGQVLKPVQPQRLETETAVAENNVSTRPRES